MLNRLFQRKYGIAVRKVGVRSEIPLPLRLIVWVGAISFSLALAGWLYDAGRRFAGFERRESEQRLEDAIARVSVLENQLARSQEALRTGEGRLVVEQSAVVQLAQRLKSAQDENLALKEELALFEGLVSTAGVSGGPAVRVVRANLERLAPGRYRYRLVLVHQSNQKNSKEFVGEFRFELHLKASGGDAMMSVPPSGVVAPVGHKLNFRQIHRVEGELNIPNGSELVGGDLFITQGGAIVLRQPLKL